MGDVSPTDSWSKLLEAPSAMGLLRLHGEIRRSMPAKRGPEEMLLRGALRLNERFHLYLVELEAEESYKHHAERASLMELASIGGLALQDVTGSSEAHSLPRLLVAGVAQGLAYLATREFVKAGASGIDGIIARNALALQEEFWSLLEDSEEAASAADAEKARDAIVPLSEALSSTRISASRRVALVTALYAMLLRARLERGLPARAAKKR